MKTIVKVALLGAVLALTACTESGHYPVSNEDCSPSDPVQDMPVADCTAHTV